MDEADYLCDRVGIIDHGKILIIDTIENLKNSIGKDVITLTCSNINNLKIRLEKEKWIHNIKKHDSKLTFGVEKGDEKIPFIIEISQSEEIKIKSIIVRKPTLDDVFLHFTGRTMRDQKNKHNIEIPSRVRFRRGRR
jgi:ABC-2 type transport system ATP-binding protein